MKQFIAIYICAKWHLAVRFMAGNLCTPHTAPSPRSHSKLGVLTESVSSIAFRFFAHISRLRSQGKPRAIFGRSGRTGGSERESSFAPA